MKVDTYKGKTITMHGLNHFACPQLKLYGYPTVKQLTRAIEKKLTAKSGVK